MSSESKNILPFATPLAAHSKTQPKTKQYQALKDFAKSRRNQFVLAAAFVLIPSSLVARIVNSNPKSLDYGSVIKQPFDAATDAARKARFQKLLDTVSVPAKYAEPLDVKYEVKIPKAQFRDLTARRIQASKEYTGRARPPSPASTHGPTKSSFRAVASGLLGRFLSVKKDASRPTTQLAGSKPSKPRFPELDYV